MKLNARQIETSKPKDKPYKLADGGGLFLLVKPNNSKLWQMKYRIAGREKLLSIGPYPDVSLADARQRRQEAKSIIAAGGDPSQEKKADKIAKQTAINNSFEALAREWHEYKRPNWSEGYAADILEGLQNDVFPAVGKRPIAEIKPLEMLEALRKMEKRGVLDKLKSYGKPAIKFLDMPLLLVGLRLIQPLSLQVHYLRQRLNTFHICLQTSYQPSYRHFHNIAVAVLPE